MRQLLYKFVAFFKDLFKYPRLDLTDVDYDEYWKDKKKDRLGRPNNWQKYRAHWISQNLMPGDSVIDVGCGDGSVLLQICERVSISPIGADVSKIALSILLEKKVPIHHIDFTQKDPLDSLPGADHLLLLEVIEHLPNSENFLLKAIEKSNKSLFFSVPNSGYLKHRLRLLLGRFPLQWRKHPGEHLRFWTLKDLKWWLTELKLLENAKIHCYEGIPLLNKMFPSLFAAGVIVQIKKNNSKKYLT